MQSMDGVGHYSQVSEEVVARGGQRSWFFRVDRWRWSLELVPDGGSQRWSLDMVVKVGHRIWSLELVVSCSCRAELMVVVVGCGRRRWSSVAITQVGFWRWPNTPSISLKPTCFINSFLITILNYCQTLQLFSKLNTERVKPNSLKIKF